MRLPSLLLLVFELTSSSLLAVHERTPPFHQLPDIPFFPLGSSFTFAPFSQTQMAAIKKAEPTLAHKEAMQKAMDAWKVRFFVLPSRFIFFSPRKIPD